MLAFSLFLNELMTYSCSHVAQFTAEQREDVILQHELHLVLINLFLFRERERESGQPLLCLGRKRRGVTEVGRARGLVEVLTLSRISASEPIIWRAPSFFLGSEAGSVRIW